jgi:hypothetical protein
MLNVSMDYFTVVPGKLAENICCIKSLYGSIIHRKPVLWKASTGGFRQ